MPAIEPHAEEVCGALQIAESGRAEILRYLGYAPGMAPKPAIQASIDSIVAQVLPLLRPRGAFAVYPAAHRTAGSLELSGVAIRGRIGEFLRDARRVAVFVVTVGEEISARAQAAAGEGDAFTAWVVDAVGSWAAESAANALMLRLRRHLEPGEDLTLRYSPGYCGMDIGQQRELFRLVPAADAGVQLLPSMLMHPLKSISGLAGLAPGQAVARYSSPCDLCAKTRCHMRRPGSGHHPAA